MKAGDLVRVVKNDMSLAFNAKTRMKDKKFFNRTGIVIDIYQDLNLRRRGDGWVRDHIQYSWYDVYFGSVGLYHVREDILVVENESR